MTVHDSPTLLAETRAFVGELERLLATLPPLNSRPPEETRRNRREGRGIFPKPVFLPEAQIRQIDGPAGPLTLRTIPPDGEPDGVFLHFHGGGWALGSCDEQDLRLQRVARETGLTVISVGYRLAPEHPYPAGADDCEAAALWLLEHRAELLPGGGPLVVGGDSAGGNLTAVTLLRLRDRHGITGAFSGAVLTYGAFDLSMTPSQRLWGERNLVLSTPIIEWFNELYVPGITPEERRNPDISPLYADLSGMPPAVFTVGTQDPLLDDTLFMEARWRAAGHDTELHIWPEAPHALVALPMTAADAALTAEHEFVRQIIGKHRVATVR